MNETTKFAIVGLSKAGKTSIYRRCFEAHDIKDIEQTPPTIMIAQNLVNLGHISKGISIWDFGGQRTFREAYLQNPDYFLKTKILLFVVDVLSSEDYAEEKKYFNSILKIFEDLSKTKKDFEHPQKYVFLHKCDPNKKSQINEKIARCLIEMTTLFGKEVPYYMTSIYDDSACRSLNNILFFSLPEEVIGQIFSKAFFEDLRKAISSKIKNNPSIEISEVSKIFGDMMGRKLHDLWIASSIKKTEKFREKSKGSDNLQIIYEKNGNKKFQLKCPYSDENQKCSDEDCIIVQGFIAGMLTSLNLSQRSLKIERIKEKDNCYFIF
ncbi:MAG: ADP-ribosylation factor-like protein [Candidatus Helarchaeota archaeon]